MRDSCPCVDTNSALDTGIVLHEFRVMKRNITIALDETTARWARIQAARSDTSVSEFLGSILRERMAAEERYEHAMSGWLSAEPAALKKKSGKYPTREEVHERRRVR